MITTFLGHVPISGVRCLEPRVIPKRNGTTKETGERGFESMAGSPNPQLVQSSRDIRGELRTWGSLAKCKTEMEIWELSAKDGTIGLWGNEITYSNKKGRGSTVG